MIALTIFNTTIVEQEEEYCYHQYDDDDGGGSTNGHNDIGVQDKSSISVLVNK